MHLDARVYIVGWHLKKKQQISGVQSRDLK